MAAGDDESAFPDFPAGLVKPQTDSVVAFIDEPDQVVAAMEELVEHGFDRDKIYVLCGPKGVERLNVDGRRRKAEAVRRPHPR